ncbi:5-methylcytosine restriction system specificity protein McrC [Burkholderia sp. 22313]|uniref:5-methylcytosine restriction system specificity protein McrC n=1 Tax=Burkholderia sp. 22313 TaxID=3453908 RepID=UPI003F82D089
MIRMESRREPARCEEWRKLRIGPGEAIPSLDAATRLLAAWEQLTGIDPARYFEISHRYLRPKSWFGTIEIGDLTIEVLPRTGMELSLEAKKRFDSNVDLMLSALANRPYRELGGAQISAEGGRYDALVQSFCQYVHDARRRQIVRRYRGMTGTFEFPVGSLRFPQQALTQIRNPQQFECSWVELTQDVPENQFIKAVLIAVRSRCSATTQKRVESLLVEFEAVAQIDQPLDIIQRIRLDRLPRIYSDVVALGKELIEGNALGILFGSISGMSQVVLSPVLFESYIGQQMDDLASDRGWSCLRGEGRTFLWQRQDGSGVGQLKPDIRLVDGDGRTRMVIDTKWKFPDNSADWITVSREDATQIGLYAAKFGVCDVGLVYPNLDPGVDGPAIERLTGQLDSRKFNLYVTRVPLLGKELGGLKYGLEALLRLVQTEALSTTSPESDRRPAVSSPASTPTYAQACS